MHGKQDLIFFLRNQNGIKSSKVIHLAQGVQKIITQSSFKVNVCCQKQTKKYIHKKEESYYVTPIHNKGCRHQSV